jgi:hypothetical protein
VLLTIVRLQPLDESGAERRRREMVIATGFKNRAERRMKTESRKRVHHACLDNLHDFLEGQMSFEEWELRQEELESQLSPEPELPLLEIPSEREKSKRHSKQPKAA